MLYIWGVFEPPKNRLHSPVTTNGPIALSVLAALAFTPTGTWHLRLKNKSDHSCDPHRLFEKKTNLEALAVVLQTTTLLAVTAFLMQPLSIDFATFYSLNWSLKERYSGGRRACDH